MFRLSILTVNFWIIPRERNISNTPKRTYALNGTGSSSTRATGSWSEAWRPLEWGGTVTGVIRENHWSDAWRSLEWGATSRATVEIIPLSPLRSSWSWTKWVRPTMKRRLPPLRMRRKFNNEGAVNWCAHISPTPYCGYVRDCGAKHHYLFCVWVINMYYFGVELQAFIRTCYL